MCLEIRLENLLEIFFVPQALFLFILHVCGQRCKVTIKASRFFFLFFLLYNLNFSFQEIPVNGQ